MEKSNLIEFGYYQVVVLSGLMQKKRVVTNDRYSKACVPHSPLCFDKMLDILSTNQFQRSKSLYKRLFPVKQQWQQQQCGQKEQQYTIFTHNSFYKPRCQLSGRDYILLVNHMGTNRIPYFHQPNWDEHSNIISIHLDWKKQGIWMF